MAEHDPQDKHHGPHVFDRPLVRANRARARKSWGKYGFLHNHVAEELSDRLLAVRRSFKTSVELGARTGAFAATEAGQKLERLIGIDLVPPYESTKHSGYLIADEERLPLADASINLLIAPLCLHVVNDLPGTLRQIRNALKPDGLFVGTLFGGETLTALRAALMEAEIETTGGAAPHIAPAVDIRDAGWLLLRSGYALPVSDADTLTVNYDSAFDLMNDLRGMGEGNTLTDRHRGFARRETFLRAAEIYQDRHAGHDGRIEAKFEILYLMGWAPHPSQQTPLKPGSGTVRLADAIGNPELSAEFPSKD